MARNIKLNEISYIEKEIVVQPSVALYEINGIDESNSSFLYRVPRSIFKLIPKGDYRIETIGNKKYIRILNNEILQSEKIQIISKYDFTASKYETQFNIDINLLAQRYNELVDVTKRLWLVSKQQSFIGDALGSDLILPELDDKELFIKVGDHYEGITLTDAELEIKKTIDRYVADYKVQLNSHTNTKISEINNTKNQAVSTVNATRDSANADITNKTNAHINTINNTKDSALSNINNKKQESLTSLQTEQTKLISGARTNIQGFTDSQKTKLENSITQYTNSEKERLTNNMNTYVDNQKSGFNEFVSNHIRNIKGEVKRYADDYTILKINEIRQYIESEVSSQVQQFVYVESSNIVKQYLDSNVERFRGLKGDTGKTGNGIHSISATGNTLQIDYTNGENDIFTIPTIKGDRGLTGATGNGIHNIENIQDGVHQAIKIVYTDGNEKIVRIPTVKGDKGDPTDPTELNKKIDKTSISSSLNSTSTATVLSSAGAKALEDNKVKSNGYIASYSNNAVPWDAKTGVYKNDSGGSSELIFHMYSGSTSANSAQLKFNYKNRGLWYRSSRDGFGFEEDFTRIWTEKDFNPDTKLTRTINGDLEGLKRGTNGIFLSSGNTLNFSSNNNVYHFNYHTFPESQQILEFYLNNGDSKGGMADLYVKNLFTKGGYLQADSGSDVIWSNLRLITRDGYWRFEAHPYSNGSGNKRMNLVYNNGSTDTFLAFPDIGSGQYVAYRSWVDAQRTWANVSGKPAFNNTVTSTSTTEFATPNSVKTAYDRGTSALNTANTKVNKAGDTMTGNLTVPTCYTSNWFRSTGNTGWYSETYSGGIYMTDTTWIRTYNDKGILVNNTIQGNKVLGAWYNDYAERFPKSINCNAIPGDLISLDMDFDNECYCEATKGNSVVGIYSDEYGMLIGGDKPKDFTGTFEEYIKENEDKYIPVGLVGRCKVNFVGKAKKGEYIVLSDIKGKARLYNKDTDSILDIVGILVEEDNITDNTIRRLRVKLGR